MRIIPAALLFLITLKLFSLEDENDDDEYLFIEDEGISVVGTAQTSQQMAVVDRDEIQRRNAPDVAALLQESLGLNIVRYGSYGNQAGISLRGLDSKRIAILIDGVPADSALDGKFDISQIDLNSVERIEVIYGGSDSRYNISGAMGGMINIITVKKQPAGLRLGASVSNTSALPGEYRGRSGQTQGPDWEDLADTQNIDISGAYGGSGFSVTANAFANRAENHFLFVDRYNYTRRKDNNEVWDAGGAVSVIGELSDFSKLIFSSNFYYGGKNIPTSGFSSNVGKQQDISSRNNVMLDMPRAFRDDLAMEASLGWHFVRRDYTAPSSGVPPADDFSRHDQQNITAINRWNWYTGEKLALKSGFDYRFIYLDSTDIGKRNRHDGGIYLTAEYKPVQKFLVIPSVKAVFASEGDTPFTAVPKLGLLWNVTDSLALKNNYFRSFKFPDFEELYWGEGGGAAGNPDLKPEDGWGGDIGLSWRFKELFNFESTFFTHWLKDSIHWYQGTGGVWRPENVGEAMFFGLDSKITFNIPVSLGSIKKIIPSVSYQCLLSYLLSFGYDFADNKRIPYSPVHTIGASLEVPWNTGSVIISAHYESLRYNDRANLTELEPYFLLNASVNQKIGKNFAVFGVLRNILNESYESFSDYPMPGITLTIGLRANLEIK
ncbi:MAG: TonB-dependent receptor [Treponema sp.]|jgi:vitamin B12 transporter|nr:TonB-dependent receptor [Treponema sp.]